METRPAPSVGRCYLPQNTSRHTSRVSTSRTLSSNVPSVITSPVISTHCTFTKNLTSHLRRDRCDQCPRLFNTVGHLNQHKVEHMGKAGPCPHCQKTFAQKSGLKRHLEICPSQPGGPPPKRHKCCICDKVYAGSSDLTRHVKQKHGFN